MLASVSVDLNAVRWAEEVMVETAERLYLGRLGRKEIFIGRSFSGDCFMWIGHNDVHELYEGEYEALKRILTGETDVKDATALAW